MISLAARLVITGIGVAAGVALWMRRPGAVWLTKLALTLFALEAGSRFSSRFPFAGFIVLHNAAWLVYLQRSHRVRAAYGLESQPDRT